MSSYEASVTGHQDFCHDHEPLDSDEWVFRGAVQPAIVSRQVKAVKRKIQNLQVVCGFFDDFACYGYRVGIVSCSDIHNRWVLLARQQYTESYKEKPVGLAVPLQKTKVQLTCSPLVKPLAIRIESRLESIAVVCGGSGSKKTAT